MESKIEKGQIYEFFTCYRQDGKQWQVINVGFNVVRLVSRKTGIQTNLDPASLLDCKRIW